MSNGNNKSLDGAKADLVVDSRNLGSKPAHRVLPMHETTFSSSSDPADCFGDRTKVEKRLGAATFLLVAIVLAEAAAIAVLQTSRGRPVCNTEACVSAAASLMRNMNQSVDPCEDFYEFACGAYIQNTRIPDDDSSRDAFDPINEEIDLQMRSIIQEGMLEEYAKKHDVYKIPFNAYKACMNMDRLNDLGNAEAIKILDDLGGWPVLKGDSWNEQDFNWQKLMFQYRRRGLSSDYVINLSVDIDLANPSRRILTLDDPPLGLTRELLLKGMGSEVKAYFNMMKNTALYYGGTNETLIETELKAALDFERSLAGIMQNKEETRDTQGNYHVMTLGEINAKVNISGLVDDWTYYVNQIMTEKILQVNSSEPVVVYSPSFLQKLSQLLKATPKRTQANYLLFRIAYGLMGYLDTEAYKLLTEFSANVTGTLDKCPTRWKTCVPLVTNIYPAVIGALYVRRHFDSDHKAVMTQMVSDIRAEFNEILDEVTWMDQETREKAHAKLHAMGQLIGFPDEILEEENLKELFEGLEIKEDEYLRNVLRSGLWATERAYKRLREPVEPRNWKTYAIPHVVNAFYSPTDNAIIFPAAVLQGVFFNKDRPAYLNYGGIGTIIGHEITHGFDDQGRQYNENGTLIEWWDNVTKATFDEKKQCIVDQYNAYLVDQINETVNGINTQGENIADNGGVKEAYRAYKKWVSRNGPEPVLPGLTHLTPEQLFWLGTANNWCAKQTSRALRVTVMSANHPPQRFRVIGPFSNNDDFARDFQCQPGQGMNPQKKCRVW